MIWTLLFACSGGGGDDATVTFYDDVAPILDANCMQCHSAGGIGPMDFETYEATAPWAEAIAASTAARTMPPKQVVQDGSCGDFVDPWWVSDEDIATLESWAAQGAPEGEVRERDAGPPIPTIEPTDVMTTPDFVPEIVGTSYAEFDEYRCFALEIDSATTDRFLTGFDVFPGNPAILHHVVGHIVDPEAPSDVDGRTNAEQMAFLDAESPDRLGWPCFESAGEDVEYSSDPMAWAPGQGATSLPEGTGVRVPAGSVLVVQMHYNLIDPATIGGSDSTEIHLRTEAEVDRELYPLYVDFLLAEGATIPAGESAYLYETEITPGEIGIPIDLEIFGVMPHMHERGRQLDLSVADQCITEVPNWDFDWQFVYFYEEPVRIRPEDALRLACTYDTSGDSEPVTAGWGTQNEMCLAVLYAAFAL